MTSAVEHTFRVHDLIRLNQNQVAAACKVQPHWVGSSLAHTPWVVVRRSLPTSKTLAVGVRGEVRQERWGGLIGLDAIDAVRTPDQLRSSCVVPDRLLVPALQALISAEKKMADFDLVWGPVGSVGFELASGRPAATRESDLDLVIYAAELITRREARRIWKSVCTHSTKVDVRVETPYCGFFFRRICQ